MTYYFVFIFQSHKGIGYGNTTLDITGKITGKTLAEVQDYIYNENKDEWAQKPIILNWRKLEEE